MTDSEFKEFRHLCYFAVALAWVAIGAPVALFCLIHAVCS